MYHVEIALFVIGIVLVVVGYRRNGHNLPLAGAVVPSLSAALPRSSATARTVFREPPIPTLQVAESLA